MNLRGRVVRASLADVIAFKNVTAVAIVQKFEQVLAVNEIRASLHRVPLINIRVQIVAVKVLTHVTICAEEILSFSVSLAKVFFQVHLARVICGKMVLGDFYLSLRNARVKLLKKQELVVGFQPIRADNVSRSANLLVRLVLVLFPQQLVLLKLVV